MFAGKTSELIRRARLHAAAGNRVTAIAPARDTRYGPARIASHTGDFLEAAVIGDAAELLRACADSQAVVIDEAHFFGDGLTTAIRQLLATGTLVIIAGIERNHRGEPFPPFPALLCEADEVVKLSSKCARCGGPAIHSQRLFKSDEAIVVGGADSYEARCRLCFNPNEPESLC